MGLENLLVGLVVSLFQTIASTYIIIKQSEAKNNKLLFFVCMFIYSLITFYFIPNELRFAIFVLVISLLSYFILKIRDNMLMLYSFFAVVAFAISEIFISIILVVCGVDSIKIVNDIFINMLANILISLLSIGLIKLPFIKKITTKIKQLFLKNKNFRKYYYLIILVLYLIIAKNGFEFLLRSNYYFNILFITGVVIILTIMTKNELKSEQLKEEYQQMLNYVSKYENIITEQGKANHEFKNQLMVIRGYAQMNSPKLIEYIDSITEDTRKTQSSYMISQLNKFPDGGIKGLLYYKLATMAEENICYDLQVEPGVKLKLSKLSVVMYKNITKILGVLLDNAIDASKKSKLKKIIILVEKDNNNVIFNIQNSYKGKIELSKFGTGYTTKGNKHGYGLRLIKDIIEENKQFDIEKSCDKEYFYTRLIIKINNKKRKSNK